MRVRATRLSATGGHHARAPSAAAILAALRAQGVPIVNQLLSDQWAYQQQMLAQHPGDASKCVLFQDAAGTIPVTAMEQPIGLSLDMEMAGQWNGVTPIASLPGTHMAQGTTAKRALLSARVNRFSTTNLSSWSVSIGGTGQLVADLGAVAGPSGALTGRRWQLSVGAGTLSTDIASINSPQSTFVSGVGYKTRVAMRTGDGSTAAVTLVYATAASITATVTGEWQVFEFDGPGLVSTAYAMIRVRLRGNEPTSKSVDICIADPDVRLSVDAHPSIPSYQASESAAVYDTAGFPVYKRFDGTDDAYASVSTLDLTGTDELSLFAPIFKESDAAPGMVLEASPTIGANNGAFYLIAPASAEPSVSFASKGTAANTAFNRALPAPLRAVATGVADISAPLNRLHINGAEVGSNAAAQGTGNYGNHTLFEGARAGTSLYFRGEGGGYLLIGKVLTPSQQATIERAINNTWRAY